MADMLTAEQLRIVPANEASWEDFQTVFGTRGDPRRCQCQWFKLASSEWRGMPPAELESRQRGETNPGDPGAEVTTGLIAYVDAEPAGWVAVEPRVNYLRLKTQRIPWLGRTEDKEDGGVWAMTCFVVRPDFRRRGLMHALVHAAAGFARERGATAVEGYPMIVRPGQEITWGELFVGARSAFAAAGFGEVSHPTERRVVMRIDF
ncbi:MAG TPA: GNAT family N-acetyltransferase [Gryllotalpicola sp.]